MPILRGAWLVRVPGYAAFPMLCEPCTEAEALSAARVIWPAAEVESY